MQANRAALVANLAGLTHERHAKFAGTFYHLEPNVKETPGGLRDYQLHPLAGATARRRRHPRDRAGFASAAAFPEHLARSRWWLH